MTKKIALVVTSASNLNGHLTGLWLEECAVPYYMFIEKGYDVILISPAGGPIPLDSNSLRNDFFVSDSKKFLHDPDAMNMLCHTKKVSDIDFTTIDVIYLAGGHGTCVDFISNPTLKAAIETVYAANKIVAADCHGPIAFAECYKPDGTTPLVKDKIVTGFANSEEYAVQLEKLVPYLLESKLKELGAKYEKANDDWNVKVCIDNNLITGQNPASSYACAQAVINVLEMTTSK